MLHLKLSYLRETIVFLMWHENMKPFDYEQDNTDAGTHFRLL